MMSNNGTQVVAERKIDLFNLLQLLRKWKWLILSGTAVFILVTAITSYRTPKLYAVGMVIQPGILNISDNGRISYFDDHNTIISLINWGIFKKEIKQKVKLSDAEANYVQTRIRAVPRKKTNIIEVRYEATSAKGGETILNILLEMLSDYYQNITSNQIEDYQGRITDLQSLVRELLVHEKNGSLNLNYLQKRISDLTIQIENTEKKIGEINSLIELKGSTGLKRQPIDVESLNYTLYQLLNLKNDYKKQIDTYKKQAIDQENQIATDREKQSRSLYEIKNIEKQKNELKAIHIISPPRSNNSPIKDKIYLKIFLSAVAGFISTVLLSLLIDSLMRGKLRNSK